MTTLSVDSVSGNARPTSARAGGDTRASGDTRPSSGARSKRARLARNAYIGVVAGAAVALVAADTARLAAWPYAQTWMLLVILVAACAGADHLGFQIRRNWTTTAGAVPQIAAAFLLPPGLAALVACAGALTRVVTHRVVLPKATFNLSSVTVNVAVASHVAGWFGAPGILADGTSWVGPMAAIVASGAYYLVTSITVAGVVALDQRLSYWEVLRTKGGLKILVEIGLGLVGATLAVLLTASPAWSPMLILPAVLVYLAKQTTDAAARRSRDLALTSAVGRAVAGTLKPEVAFEVIAGKEVRDALRLDGIALVPLDEDQAPFNEYRVVDAERDQPALCAVLRQRVALSGRRIEVRGEGELSTWLPPDAQPLAAVAVPFGVTGAPPVGALIAWRAPQASKRPTFTADEVLVLDTLADYATVSLETARLAAAEAFREVQALREVARLKDEFLGQVSHELRTPLTIIHGFMEMLALGLVSDPDAVRRLTRPAYESSTLMMRLVEDLLETAHLETGALSLKMEDVDLGPWLERMSAAFGAAVPTHHVLASGVSAALPPVRADLVRLGQVLNNLLSNAVRYSPAGSEVLVLARAVAGGREVEIRVADEGPGISPEEQDRIFEKFYRGKNGAIQTHRGTGLGLAVARALVEAHHGSIGVDSEPGRGASFWVRLPSVPLPAAAAGAAPGPAQPHAVAAEPLSTLPGAGGPAAAGTGAGPDDVAARHVSVVA